MHLSASAFIIKTALSVLFIQNQKEVSYDSPQKQNKTILWIAAALVIAVAVFALCYLFFAPQAADGAKTITIAVTDDQDATIVYETTTNAQYLRQAMEDTKDLTFQGTEGQYGLMLDIH